MRLAIYAFMIFVVTVILATRLSAATDRQVFTNTRHVEDVVIHGSGIWVASTGGLERYDVATRILERHYTTGDGLPDNHVRSLRLDGSRLTIRTHSAVCTLVRERFQCMSAAPYMAAPQASGRFQGSRVTVHRFIGSRELIGTAGSGLWITGRKAERITPVDQICSNHIITIAAFKSLLWMGSFDEGLCSTTDGKSFARHKGLFRMINDLEPTPKGLYIAASEGLFLTRDGKSFEKIEFISEKGVNGLAFDGKSLWVTTPATLWRLRVAGGHRNGSWWLPGGTHSIQSVSVGPDGVWLATEDRGAVFKNGKNFEVFDKAYGLPTSWGIDISIGKDGTAYMASLRNGLIAINRQQKNHRVLLPETWLLFVDATSDHVMVGAQGGATLMGDKARRVSLPEQSLPNPNVHAMYVNHEKLYVATEGGMIVTSF